MLRRRRLSVVSGRRVGVLSALAAVGVVLALAFSASPALPSTQASQPARLTVGVQVLRFTNAGRTVRGVGLVTATLTNQAGQAQTVRARVAFIAATGPSCRILNLVLNQLHLSLLGLNVDLAKVVLNITGIRSGRPGGGVLGSLFCSLASTRLAADQRAHAARALSAGLQRQPNRLLRFTVNLRPSATTRQAGATCPVLDLVLGPLHLDLLGLVVDLNQVHLTVTATQGGGILGSLFCSLANTTVPVP